MADPGATGVRPGDLGRRVHRRRVELGLSLAQVAQRAGISPEYLSYLEEHPATPSPGTVLRVAEALDTTPWALLGGDTEAAPGATPPERTSPPVRLDRDECLRLLGRRGVGRVAVWTDTGPLVVPVNYVVAGDEVVFRTASGTALTQAILKHHVSDVAFEVDRIDDALQQGWSVLVVGTAHEVAATPGQSDVLRRRLRPWAGGVRDVVLAVPLARVTGRRVDPG